LPREFREHFLWNWWINLNKSTNKIWDDTNVMNAMFSKIQKFDYLFEHRKLLENSINMLSINFIKLLYLCILRNRNVNHPNFETCPDFSVQNLHRIYLDRHAWNLLHQLNIRLNKSIVNDIVLNNQWSSSLGKQVYSVWEARKAFYFY